MLVFSMNFLKKIKYHNLFFFNKKIILLITARISFIFIQKLVVFGSGEPNNYVYSCYSNFSRMFITHIGNLLLDVLNFSLF